MKLIVAGASGFVGTEVIRQCLSLPMITSVIALARRPVSAPSDLDHHAVVSKLHSVVLDDYGTYPEHVKKELAGADACIWYVNPPLYGDIILLITSASSPLERRPARTDEQHSHQ